MTPEKYVSQNLHSGTQLIAVFSQIEISSSLNELTLLGVILTVPLIVLLLGLLLNSSPDNSPALLEFVRLCSLRIFISYRIRI